MRSNVSRLIGAFTLALVISCAGTAAASAASWHVGGAELLSSAPLASTTESSGVVLEAIGGPSIECVEQVLLSSASITHPSGGAIGHLVLEGCAATEPPCVLVEPTIESKPLKLEAALGSKSPEDTLLVKPESGTTVAEFSFGNPECHWYGKQKITGQAKFIMPHGREELSSQEVQFHAGAAELRFAGLEERLKGSVKVKLASGSAWSFR